jgi:hypothetical protein
LNKQRREQISRAIAFLEEAQGILELAKDDEQSYYDDMPENLQGSDKGQAAEEAISNLETAIGSIEDAIGEAGEAKGD